MKKGGGQASGNRCSVLDATHSIPKGSSKVAGGRRPPESQIAVSPPQGRIPNGVLAPWFVPMPASEATEHLPTASMPPACALEKAWGSHVIQGSFDPWLPSMIPSGSWIHSPSAKYPNREIYGSP